MTTLDGLDEKLDRLAHSVDALLQQAGQPELLTLDAAAKTLSVSTKTVRRMLTAGRLRAVRLGRTWRVPLGEIQRLVRSDDCTSTARRRRRRQESTLSAREMYERGLAKLKEKGGGH